MPAPGDQVLGIHYPERAEGLGDYKDYKVFVEFWDPLIEKLSENYRRLAFRRETRILGVFGEQGAGKTLFSNQLQADFEAAKLTTTADPQNVWHAVTKADQTPVESPRPADFYKIEGDEAWVEQLIAYASPTPRDIVAVADNTETYYFLRGLAGKRLPGKDRHDPELLRVAAERFVQLARKELRGVTFILLSNDRDFLRDLCAEVEEQHSGLMSVEQIPLPSAHDKERAVRVNINRLNKVSYWYCLDRGGLPQKKEVHNRLSGATTFPKAFEAVDAALQSAGSRTGRPPRRNLLTLVCLSGDNKFAGSDYGLGASDVEAEGQWHVSLLHDKGWADSASLGPREASLLESEWQFRLVVLGSPFVAALLASDPNGDTAARRFGDSCREFLRRCEQALGPTSNLNTRETYRRELTQLATNWPVLPPSANANLLDFWGRNQGRSTLYEPKLKALLGKYDEKAAGFIDARPDYVVRDYVPCSVLSAVGLKQAELNTAIRRDAHAVEFTAQKEPSSASIAEYLSKKLPNYLAATQNQ